MELEVVEVGAHFYLVSNMVENALVHPHCLSDINCERLCVSFELFRINFRFNRF